jgi:hypothetical protein
MLSAVERHQIGERFADVAGVDRLVQVLEHATNFSRYRVRIRCLDAILNIEIATPVHRLTRGSKHASLRAERIPV